MPTAHINDRHLPDKAIDVVDEAGARLRLQPAEVEAAASASAWREIEESWRKHRAHPAEERVVQDDRELLQNLERNLKAGDLRPGPGDRRARRRDQDGALGLGRSAQARSAVFLFAGPTGVGKTEVTRQLALALGIEFIRFDMSEYMERHTVSRLIGAPPGYVGFDQGGLLTEAITKHPHCGAAAR